MFEKTDGWDQEVVLNKMEVYGHADSAKRWWYTFGKLKRTLHASADQLLFFFAGMSQSLLLRSIHLLCTWWQTPTKVCIANESDLADFIILHKLRSLWIFRSQKINQISWCDLGTEWPYSGLSQVCFKGDRFQPVMSKLKHTQLYVCHCWSMLEPASVSLVSSLEHKNTSP